MSPRRKPAVVVKLPVRAPPRSPQGIQWQTTKPDWWFSVGGFYSKHSIPATGRMYIALETITGTNQY